MKKILVICLSFVVGLTGLTACGNETQKSDGSVQPDIDIVLREGHPTYYGSIEQSHQVWDDVSDKVIFGDDSKYDIEKKPEAILHMSGYTDSDLIRDVRIYIEDFKTPATVDLEKALTIAAEYLPFDIIDQYYEYRDSRKYVPNEDNQDENTKYYVVSYHLTDDGNEAYYSGEHEYSGTIDIIISEDDIGQVKGISIGYGLPKWMIMDYEKNGYDIEEWSCDLSEYK